MAQYADERSPLLLSTPEQCLEEGPEEAGAADIEPLPVLHWLKDNDYFSKFASGDKLPYNDYTTIDWLRDLVQDSARQRAVHARKGLRYKLLGAFDSCQGWLAAALIGILTACVAFLVDVSVVTVSDWKVGYCRSNMFTPRGRCCSSDPVLLVWEDDGITCGNWVSWSHNEWQSFTIYVTVALIFGIIGGGVTMLTKQTLPKAVPLNDGENIVHDQMSQSEATPAPGKSMYMAAGSGIPEIKTILSGFVIPRFLDLNVLVVKAVGSIFAVSTGMCLGKEGPFVHISGCVTHVVGTMFPKYKNNGRKFRELLAAGCSSGLSVAFGAPIGGVLFSYEEVSTHFPRKVLWRSFLCSLFAAVTLKGLNPTGTGKLVLFETKYGTSYRPELYFVFVGLGAAGGLFGGVFCKANFFWSRSFRKYALIKNHPVFEVFLVVLATAILQYPNPLTRQTGDVIIKRLLDDCRRTSAGSWVCANEQNPFPERTKYLGWLLYGTVIKLVLTIVTFGCKVPSGVIIPALDGGAFFGRLVGQLLPDTSPGIFAMVGAGAFLAGVSRMTISLAVIMFELTGELEYIVPQMIGILVAKWVADSLEEHGVYDLAQVVLGHPFLDTDSGVALVQRGQYRVEQLIPAEQTMSEITVRVPSTGLVSGSMLKRKLSQLQRRGLLDAGLVLVQDEMLQGYLAQVDLVSGFRQHRFNFYQDFEVRLVGKAGADELDMSMLVDRTPLSICAKAPMEYAVVMFGHLGIRQLCVLEEKSGKLVGVILKKRLMMWLEGLQAQG